MPYLIVTRPQLKIRVFSPSNLNASLSLVVNLITSSRWIMNSLMISPIIDEDLPQGMGIP